MRVHYLQHVDFEDLGTIADWATDNNHPITATRWQNGEAAASLDSFDLLVIMGGPMNIYEEPLYPWLRDEKRFIADAIAAKKAVLGVCLGAQLIADVLGGKVYPNQHKEIGWFPVQKAPGASGPFANVLPRTFSPFHWHGDTFSLPPGASHLARSEGCENQAFSVGECILGLQFHLEVTPNAVQAWTENGGAELVNAPYIQQPKNMLADTTRFDHLRVLMNDVLNHFDDTL